MHTSILYDYVLLSLHHDNFMMHSQCVCARAVLAHLLVFHNFRTSFYIVSNIISHDTKPIILWYCSLFVYLTISSCMFFNGFSHSNHPMNDLNPFFVHGFNESRIFIPSFRSFFQLYSRFPQSPFHSHGTFANICVQIWYNTYIKYIGLT